MAAGKLFLLLLAGGLAGAAFAGMTTGAMRPYRDESPRPSPALASAQSNNETVRYEAHSARSWLDEGISLMESPAWPFGRGSSDEDAVPADGDEPYGYEQPGRYAERHYDDSRWDEEDGPGPGYRHWGGEASDGHPPAGTPAQEPAPLDRWDAQQLPSRPDDAAAAAGRAAEAARDVITAEGAQ